MNNFKLIAVTLLCSLNSLFCFSHYSNIEQYMLTVPASEVISYEVIPSNFKSSSFVVIHKKDGTFIINVLSYVATSLIPSAAKGICDYVSNEDSEVCNAVHDVSDILVGLKGNKIYKKISHGLRWIVKKAGYNSKSSAAVEAKTWNIAEKVAKVFDLHAKYGNIKYTNSDYDYGNDYDYCTCPNGDENDLITAHNTRIPNGSLSSTENSSYYEIQTRNDSYQDVRLTICYLSDYEEWEFATYNIQGFSKAILGGVKTKNRIYYYYAESENCKWSGNKWINYSGQNLEFREVKVGDLYLISETNLTCDY